MSRVKVQSNSRPSVKQVPGGSFFRNIVLSNFQHNGYEKEQEQKKRVPPLHSGRETFY